MCVSNLFYIVQNVKNIFDVFKIPCHMSEVKKKAKIIFRFWSNNNFETEKLSVSFHFLFSTKGKFFPLHTQLATITTKVYSKKIDFCHSLDSESVLIEKKLFYLFSSILRYFQSFFNNSQTDFPTLWKSLFSWNFDWIIFHLVNEIRLNHVAPNSRSICGIIFTDKKNTNEMKENLFIYFKKISRWIARKILFHPLTRFFF